jgi:hypothetical protein
MDEIDIAVLDMRAFEFKIECHDAYKHKGDGVLMHHGPADATHYVQATCGYCSATTEETAVCLSFIEAAYSTQNLKWRCVMCRSENRYSATIKAVGI